MNTLLLSTKSELKKLLMKKKYIIITVLCALISVVRIGGNMLVSKLSGGEIIMKSNLLLEMLPLVTDILVPLIVFMAVTDLFACETQDDTMKASLMRPITRFKVLASKTLAASALGCMAMLSVFVISIGVQSLTGGTIRSAGLTIAAYLIDMIPILALAGLALLINLIAKSPTLAMLLCIVVYIFFKYLNYYVSPFGQMIFTAYTQWHKLWIGSALPVAYLSAKIGVLFGSILILYTISYIIFEKKDF